MPTRLSKSRFLAILALGLFGDPAGASQEATDMKLENAGFKMRLADTAEKIRHARLPPPRKFVARVKDGKRYYIYSDPDYCKCVFVGDETAMNTYRDMIAAPPKDLAPTVIAPSGITPERLMVEDMNADVSNLIDDGNILDWKF
ncbi:MAG: hypothetical protein ACK4UO_09065 [Pseudolabrys sp.]